MAWGPARFARKKEKTKNREKVRSKELGQRRGTITRSLSLSVSHCARARAFVVRRARGVVGAKGGVRFHLRCECGPARRDGREDGAPLPTLAWSRFRRAAPESPRVRRRPRAPPPEPKQLPSPKHATNTNALSRNRRKKLTKIPPSLSSIQCFGALMRFKCFVGPRRPMLSLF